MSAESSQHQFAELHDAICDIFGLAAVLIKLSHKGKNGTYYYTGQRLREHAERAHQALEALLDERRCRGKAEANAADDANANATEARMVDIFRRAAERSRAAATADAPEEEPREPVRPPAA